MENLDFSQDNLVLNSAEYISSKASHVHIDFDALEVYSKSISLQKIDHWLTHSPISLNHLSQNELLTFLFVFHSLSFSYWGDPDYFFIYENKTYKTSWGLIVALCIATTQNKNILDIDFLFSISDEYLGSIININCIFPMFKERCEILRSSARVIKEKFGGKINSIIDEAEHDAGKMMNLLYTNFSAFRDEGIYLDRQVFFMKKAQILIGDIDRTFPAPVGKLANIERLTACADYRLPQLMRHLGILKYSPELSAIIDSKKIIDKNSSYELEIRGSTIKVNEEIRKILENKFSQNIRALDVNDFLWISAKETKNMKPYHLVRTTMY